MGAIGRIDGGEDGAVGSDEGVVPLVLGAVMLECACVARFCYINRILGQNVYLKKGTLYFFEVQGVTAR